MQCKISERLRGSGLKKNFFLKKIKINFIDATHSHPASKPLSEMEAPPYEPNSYKGVNQAGEQDEKSLACISKMESRIRQINERLCEMGYQYSSVECPEYLTEFEQKNTFQSDSVLDAVTYKQKMDKYLDHFHNTKAELMSKVNELEELGIETDDIGDFVWKEEIKGAISRRTIKSYYDIYQNASHSLLKFLGSIKPVDGQKLFVEKNLLVGEKIDLLVKMRKLELKALLPESVE